jgi:hypothetical protein
MLTTVNAARVLAAGQAVTVAVSPRVAALTEGVLKAMLMRKLKVGVVLLVAVVLLGAAGTAYCRFGAEPPERTTVVVKAAPGPSREAASRSGATGDKKLQLPRSKALEQVLVALDKDGKVVVKVSIGRAYTYEAAELRVLDTKGNTIDRKELAKRIQGPTVALAADHGLAVDPLHLRVLKEGTLVFLLPPPDPRAQLTAGGTARGASPQAPAEEQPDLPRSRPLEQVLVALDRDDNLVVKIAVTGFMLAETKRAGGESLGVELRTVEGSVTIALDRVRVLDAKGNTIDKKALAKLLQGETVALASLDGEEVDPLHLRLLREDTMILVLPGPKAKAP